MEGPEGCDDGNQSNDDACPDGPGGLCQPATCGDGFVWDGHEECDDGNQTNEDACLNNCHRASCGDGVVWAGHEECDDGNKANGDGCSASCTRESGNCGVVGSLWCGGTVSGQIASGDTSHFQNYSCTSSHTFACGDVSYTFTSGSTMQVTVNMTGDMGVDLDLFLLQGACQARNCVAMSANMWAAESFSFTAQAGVTYYIVVEAFNTGGSSANYQLALDCQ